MSGRHRQPRMRRFARAVWLPAVIAVVTVGVGYGVDTVRVASSRLTDPVETHRIPARVVQINPKTITYEVFGDLGGSGKVVYADLDSRPIEVELTGLPWSVSETTTSPSVTLSLVGQVDGPSLGCRILVDGTVRDEQVVDHDSAAVSCTVTAA